jgi:hypothetical protein
MQLWATALDSDGKTDSTEWSQAQSIDDFRMAQPLLLQPSRYPTEALYMATEDDLSIAFHNVQPASMPRTQQRLHRDNSSNVDQVSAYVDFGDDGRSGYNFMAVLSDDMRQHDQRRKPVQCSLAGC